MHVEMLEPDATDYHVSRSGKNVYMGGMAIAKSETLDVLRTSIRSDLRCDNQIFKVSKEAAKCLGFLKRCKKHFTPPIYVTYVRPKMEYNSHLHKVER